MCIVQTTDRGLVEIEGHCAGARAARQPSASTAASRRWQISATQRSRSRLPSRPRIRSRPSLRRVPSTRQRRHPAASAGYGRLRRRRAAPRAGARAAAPRSPRGQLGNVGDRLVVDAPTSRQPSAPSWELMACWSDRLFATRIGPNKSPFGH